MCDSLPFHLSIDAALSFHFIISCCVLSSIHINVSRQLRVDLYFLNRATLLHVTSSAQLHGVFAQPPSGLTPTTPVLQHVLAAKKDVIVEKKLLVIILTDGSP